MGNANLVREVEQFLYREARLLDDRRFHEWLALLDETRESLAARVARLDTGMAWAEDPPSRTRHFVANIEVEAGDPKGEITVYSNFLVYRSRAETEQDFYVGSRRDVLRRVEGVWKIAQ